MFEAGGLPVWCEAGSYMQRYCSKTGEGEIKTNKDKKLFFKMHQNVNDAACSEYEFIVQQVKRGSFGGSETVWSLKFCKGFWFVFTDKIRNFKITVVNLKQEPLNISKMKKVCVWVSSTWSFMNIWSNFLVIWFWWQSYQLTESRIVNTIFFF